MSKQKIVFRVDERTEPELRRLARALIDTAIEQARRREEADAACDEAESSVNEPPDQDSAA